MSRHTTLLPTSAAWGGVLRDETKNGYEGDNLGGHLLARITGHVQLRKEEKYKETLLT